MVYVMKNDPEKKIQEYLNKQKTQNSALKKILDYLNSGNKKNDLESHKKKPADK